MEILTVNELAEYLKCSISTVRKMVRNDTIPYFRTLKKINFDKQVIDKWVQEQYLQEGEKAHDNRGIEE